MLSINVQRSYYKFSNVYVQAKEKGTVSRKAIKEFTSYVNLKIIIELHLRLDPRKSSINNKVQKREKKNRKNKKEII